MERKSRREAENRLRHVAPLGVFTPALATAAGFTPDAVRYRITQREWRRFLGSAYLDVARLGGRTPEPRHRAVAAALTWPGAVICLRTAALLHGFPVEDDGRAHVIVAGRRRAVRGVVPHFLRLEPAETVRMRLVSRTGGQTVPLTSRRRTAIDCLAHFPAVEAEQLLAWLGTHGVVDAARLHQAIGARRGWHGTRQLRRLERMLASGALSELERRLHALLRRAGLTGWEANAPVTVAGRPIARADVLFARERLVVEVDGQGYHGDFHAERERMNRLSLAGYTVLRFTWRDVVEAPDRVVREITLARQQGQRPA